MRRCRIWRASPRRAPGSWKAIKQARSPWEHRTRSRLYKRTLERNLVWTKSLSGEGLYFCFSVAEIKGVREEICILKDSSVAFLVLFFSFPLHTAQCWAFAVELVCHSASCSSREEEVFLPLHLCRHFCLSGGYIFLLKLFCCGIA